jgi:hypothetical protein
MRSCLLGNLLPGIILAAVVHQNDFERTSGFRQGGANAIRQWPHVRALIVKRNHGGDVGSLAHSALSEITAPKLYRAEPNPSGYGKNYIAPLTHSFNIASI